LELLDEEALEKGLAVISGGILERELEVSLKSEARIREAFWDIKGE
jgi:hypothetical protein